jgi:phage baseplate assembly protein V
MFGGILMHPMLDDLIRVGKVSSIQPEKCTARVAFEDLDDVVSYELPILVRGSLQNKDYWMPEPDEQVVCLFLPSGNAQGFILGSIYSQQDTPPVSDVNKRHLAFPDGTFVEYDRQTHTLTIDAKGPINIVTTKAVTITANDHVIVNGNVFANDFIQNTSLPTGGE